MLHYLQGFMCEEAYEACQDGGMPQSTTVHLSIYKFHLDEHIAAKVSSNPTLWTLYLHVL